MRGSATSLATTWSCSRSKRSKTSSIAARPGLIPNTGDGAGILVQIPDGFLRGSVDFDLPPPGGYGVGMCFLPNDPGEQAELVALIERTVVAEGQEVLGWRQVPTDDSKIGETARAAAPVIRQFFVGAGPAHRADQDAFERKLYVIRRVVEASAGPGFYIASLSSRTLVYKGMLIAHQLIGFYGDLADERFASAMALVHSRFSTNTFPSWELAHPYRMIAHNGEINTLRGNVNWMRARESTLASELFGEDLPKILPVVRPGGSDSATFDNVLELLTLAGRSLPHALMMMIPEAYMNRDGELPPELGGFYAYHSCLMEPWDGPAAVAFTDGRLIGATLDRNGLRPGRWVLRKDGLVVLGSEAGILPDARRPDRTARPPAARQALPGRPRAGPDHLRPRGQAPGRDPEAVRRLVRREHRPLRGPAAAQQRARCASRCARSSSRLATAARTSRRSCRA